MITQLALTLIGLSTFVALANLAILAGNLVSGRRTSLIPLFGIFGAAGFLLMPASRPFAWLPLLLDPATPVFLACLPRLLAECWRTSRFNLVASYVGRGGIREVRLRLFRKQVFTLRQSFSRSDGQLGVMALSTIGSWQGEGGRIVLKIGDHEAIFGPIAARADHAIRQYVGFPSYEADPEISLAGLELVREAPAQVEG